MSPCNRCRGPVLPKTADAFRRIAGRGEMYCPECYDLLFPEQAIARREREIKNAKKGKRGEKPGDMARNLPDHTEADRGLWDDERRGE